MIAKPRERLNYKYFISVMRRGVFFHRIKSCRAKVSLILAFSALSDNVQIKMKPRNSSSELFLGYECNISR